MLFTRKSSPLDALSGQDAVLRTTGRTTPVTITVVDGKKVTLAFPKGVIAGQAILTCANTTAGLITARGAVDKDGILAVKELETTPQRRAAYRVRAACEAEVSLPGGERIPTRTIDVSVTGVRLASCPRLRVDDKVRLRLTLGADVLLVCARVARADRSGACGLRFLDLDATDDQRLGSFIADRQRDNLSVLER